MTQIENTDTISNMTHTNATKKLLLALTLTLYGLMQTGMGADRPNIVLILSDDMGYADVGAHGCEEIPTPHIDRIAREGVRFTDAYANGSPTMPGKMLRQGHHVRNVRTPAIEPIEIGYAAGPGRMDTGEARGPRRKANR